MHAARRHRMSRWWSATTRSRCATRAASCCPAKGAMRDCMAHFAASGAREAVLDEVAQGKPLAWRVRRHADAAGTHSEEQDTPGLDVIPGRGEAVFGWRAGCRTDGSRLQGASNGLEPGGHRQAPTPVWDGIASGSHFYFVHSFYAAPAHACRRGCHARITARRSLAPIARDNIFATQFHPEKSCRRRVAALPELPDAGCPDMLLIPAIDLKDGHCVRLQQGDMNASTTFGEDPPPMARRWLDAGARRLHLVDLNGAFAGQAGQREPPSNPSWPKIDGRDPRAAGRRHPRPRHHRALPGRRHQRPSSSAPPQ